MNWLDYYQVFVYWAGKAVLFYGLSADHFSCYVGSWVDYLPKDVLRSAEIQARFYGLVHEDEEVLDPYWLNVARQRALPGD